MRRLLALLVVGAIAGAAVADVPPPPPPKGKKYVSVSSEVVLAKDVTGYVFVQQVGVGFGAPKYTYEKLELTADKAKAMAVLTPASRTTWLSRLAPCTSLILAPKIAITSVMNKRIASRAACIGTTTKMKVLATMDRLCRSSDTFCAKAEAIPPT